MAPRSEEEASGVFLSTEPEEGVEEDFEVPPSRLERHGWNRGMLDELDRLIRRALEAEFERLTEDAESAERLALSLYIVDEKQFLISLGTHVRWRSTMQRIEQLQDAAGVPEELRIRGELGDVADHLGRVRHEWLTGRARRRIEERRRLARELAKASYPREELCACTDPRAHTGSSKERLIFEELRYQTLTKPAAAKRAA
jgi:hypothetical protein